VRDTVETFCARIGADPLLVQGAGGNASWKAGDTLWVKASGTWLAEAADKDIFVPVDLSHLTAAVSAGNFGIEPRLATQSPLRPSIETLLHALMPHPVVVHLHAVEVLAHLVRRDFPENVRQLAQGVTRAAYVGYHKPGAELARAIAEALAQAGTADVVMLQNHGVVIGGSDVAEVESRLASLAKVFCGTVRPLVAGETGSAPQVDEYEWMSDIGIQQLALNPLLFDRLERDWALYPDHVVFLGAHPFCYKTVDAFRTNWPDFKKAPEIVFIRTMGVMTRGALSAAKLAQLRCFYDVIARQEPEDQLTTLRPDQIAELIGWDAEKYRLGLSR
jgi:rhamnose utilization protein RhaD (predicted bifunctional aldolase and dehydrogenase)